MINSAESSQKLLFSVHDLSHKIDNLKELAISISSNTEEEYKIEGLDPLDYLKTSLAVFDDLKLLVDD